MAKLVRIQQWDGRLFYSTQVGMQNFGKLTIFSENDQKLKIKP